MTLRVLLLLPLLLTGCISAELSGVRKDLDRQLPEAAISDGYSMSFGRFSLGLARLIVGMAGQDAEPAGLVLEGVRTVKFGRYDVGGSVDGTRLAMPDRLRRYVDRRGWTHLASFRQDGEAGWVLYRARGDRITDLFVTVLADDQLVLARVSGDLSGVVLALLDQVDVRLPIFPQPDEGGQADITRAGDVPSDQ